MTMSDPIRPYLIFYRILKLFRLFGVRLCLYIVSRYFQNFWPRNSQKDVLTACWSQFFMNTDSIWNNFRRNSIFSDIVAHTVNFDDIAMEVDDPMNLLPLARQQGCLFLTFHHHFSLHFPVVLGRFGVMINALTGDPHTSPLKRLMLHYPKYFTRLERHFNGGRFLFQNPYASNYHEMRKAMRGLKQGISLVSGHDFQNPYPESNTVHIHNRYISVQAPVGVVPSCVRKEVPVIFGYLTMTDSLGFRLHLRSQGIPAADNTAQRVFDFYSAQVELALTDHPDLFDLWHLSAQH
jgi:hypothetical protein